MDSSTEYSYPRLIRRLQALLIDSLVITVGALGALVAASYFGARGVYAAFAAGLVVFLLEPVLVSSTGGTIGHHLRGLTVLHPKSKKRLNVLSATLRFIFKVLLGGLSLVTYFTTKRYQAFHDLISGSVVVLKRPQEVVAFEKRGERQFQEPGFSYPSTWRQVLMVVAWNVVFLLISLIGLGLAVDEVCQYQDAYCYAMSSVFTSAWYGFAILFLVASIYRCRSGRIFGCRRKPLVKNEQ